MEPATEDRVPSVDGGASFRGAPPRPLPASRSWGGSLPVGDDPEVLEDAPIPVVIGPKYRVPTSAATRNFLLVAGTIVMGFIIVMPMWDSARLLQDFTYVYFLGSRWPNLVIIASVASIVAYGITVLAFFTFSRERYKTEQTMLMIAMTVTSALGLAYLCIAMHLRSEASAAHWDIFFQCEHGQYTQGLYEYASVLQTLRGTPACASLPSIEKCDGYEAHPVYSPYLKQLEGNYRCAGFCQNFQGGGDSIIPGIGVGPFGNAGIEPLPLEGSSDGNVSNLNVSVDAPPLGNVSGGGATPGALDLSTTLVPGHAGDGGASGAFGNESLPNVSVPTGNESSTPREIVAGSDQDILVDGRPGGHYLADLQSVVQFSKPVVEHISSPPSPTPAAAHAVKLARRLVSHPSTIPHGSAGPSPARLKLAGALQHLSTDEMPDSALDTNSKSAAQKGPHISNMRRLVAKRLAENRSSSVTSFVRSSMLDSVDNDPVMLMLQDESVGPAVSPRRSITLLQSRPSSSVEGRPTPGISGSYPPTLFSRANYQVSCDGMAGFDLQYEAVDVGNLLFVEGIALLCASVITSLMKTLGLCLEGTQSGRQTTTSTGGGFHQYTAKQRRSL